MPVASARMYSVTPAVGALWQRLLEWAIRRAGLAVEVIDHRPPAPIAELWARTDKAGVFVCGLPYALRAHPGRALAAPVPAPARYAGRPVYCSDFVVREDAAAARLEDTFGGRIAFSVRESQSGFFAALAHLAAIDAPVAPYREIVGPCVTPRGVIEAVRDGRAEVGPVDGFALDLLRRHDPAACAGVRVIASTLPTPIPLFLADVPAAAPLGPALAAAHEDDSMRPVLEALLVRRFVPADEPAYRALAERHAATLAFWRGRPLAAAANPAFVLA